jgi:D-glycero-D-manno-heptose 1,7-bisphosphate phosphatase
MAAKELGIDLSNSFFIGDAICDVEAALAAGCVPLFVQTGLGNEQFDNLKEKGLSTVKIFRDLGQAVDFLLTFDK